VQWGRLSVGPFFEGKTMAQSAILTPTTTTPSTSTPVAIADGATAKVGLYVASGELPKNVRATVLMGTPGSATPIDELTKDRPVVNIIGPADAVTVRLDVTDGVAVGVYSNT
jgi:hypothetical protein